MELYTRPVHRITADFLGSANFIPATVEQGGARPWDDMAVNTPLGKFIARRSPEWQPGVTASLFFRPENVDCSENRVSSANGNNTGSGMIERVIFLGNSADVIIRCSDIALRVRAHPARELTTGKPVQFYVAPESCVVYPA
jgi:ABC-type sugar transport system ATPase subunit